MAPKGQQEKKQDQGQDAEKKADTPQEPTARERAAKLAEGDGIVANLFGEALTLADDKATLFTKITKNRDALRLLRDAEQMNEEQSAVVDALYPPVKRGGQKNGTADSGSDDAGKE